MVPDQKWLECTYLVKSFIVITAAGPLASLPARADVNGTPKIAWTREVVDNVDPSKFPAWEDCKRNEAKDICTLPCEIQTTPVDHRNVPVKVTFTAGSTDRSATYEVGTATKQVVAPGNAVGANDCGNLGTEQSLGTIVGNEVSLDVPLITGTTMQCDTSLVKCVKVKAKEKVTGALPDGTSVSIINENERVFFVDYQCKEWPPVPQAPVGGTGENSVAPCGDADLEAAVHFAVLNLTLESQIVDLEFTTSQNWVVSQPPPSSLALASGETADVVVRVIVPGGVATGVENVMTLTSTLPNVVGSSSSTGVASIRTIPCAPALSPFGLLSLAFLCSGAGIVIIRRRYLVA